MVSGIIYLAKRSRGTASCFKENICLGHLLHSLKTCVLLHESVSFPAVGPRKQLPVTITTACAWDTGTSGSSSLLFHSPVKWLDWNAKRFFSGKFKIRKFFNYSSKFSTLHSQVCARHLTEAELRPLLLSVCTKHTSTAKARVVDINLDRHNNQSSQHSQCQTMGDHRAPSSLWPARDPTTAPVDGSVPPTRDVASMKAEIAEIQSDTTASLDRAIAAAQAASSVGNHVSEDLQEQREQMGQIDADAREIDADLKRTAYNLKHGFSWRGALTSPFRRTSKKPSGSGIGGGANRDLSPVYKDEYSNGSSANKQSKAPAHDGSGGANKAKKGGGLLGSARTTNKHRDGKGAAGATDKRSNSNNATTKLPEHVPEGFEKQLDDLDGLLDGLNCQAKAIGMELRQQNEGVEALGATVDPLRVEAASQSKQIKRRFGVKG